MPVWAWVVSVLVVVLGGAKAYDWNAKRHGHRPGTGAEPNVDLTHHHPMDTFGTGYGGGGAG